MNPRILIVALLALVALLVGFTFHFSSKASAMEKERREAAESLLALQDSTQSSGKEKDAALEAARAQHGDMKTQLDAANAELAGQVAKLKESSKEAEAMRDAAAKLGKENAELRKQLEAARAEAKAAADRADRAERSAADAARSASAPKAAPVPAPAPAAVPAAAPGGPSSFWWGKPYYGDLELRQMMREFHNPRLALDSQALEYREARTELLRRGAAVVD